MTRVPPAFSKIDPLSLSGPKIKVDIWKFVTDTLIFFQMNQKSCAGANCFGFKKVLGGGNHQLWEEGFNPHFPIKIKSCIINQFFFIF